VNVPERVLDLFCGAGGAAMGLHRAWPQAEIVGVDIAPQRHYPFTFRQEDALRLSLEFVKTFDFIWASPLCKAHTSLISYAGNKRRNEKAKWANQIHETRELLEASYRPWCIENVVRAPLQNPIMLCGQMFGLPLIRHRLFETNFLCLAPKHPTPCLRRVIPQKVVTVVGHGGGRSTTNKKMQWRKVEGQAALGIDWMTRLEMTQAVPPAYSEYIARQFSARLHP